MNAPEPPAEAIIPSPLKQLLSKSESESLLIIGKWYAKSCLGNGYTYIPDKEMVDLQTRVGNALAAKDAEISELRCDSQLLERTEEARNNFYELVVTLKDEVKRLKVACSKEFESVQALSDENERLKQLLASLASM